MVKGVKGGFTALKRILINPEETSFNKYIELYRNNLQ
jgi:hypothetical protein